MITRKKYDATANAIRRSGIFSILVIAIVGTTLAQAAATNEAIYTGINNLRINRCQSGTKSNGVLAVSVELEEAARRRAGGVSIAEALSSSTVQFSQAEVLVVGGDLRLALTRLENRHCDRLADAGYTHVGAVFLKERWWIVLGSQAEAMPDPDSAASMADDGEDVVSRGVGVFMVDLVNMFRIEARTCGATHFAAAPELTWSDPLDQAAILHAKDMTRRRYFAHNSPEGGSIGERVQAVGYHFRAIGENIAVAPADEIEQVMSMWIKSPGHCANMMNPQFTELGAALAHVSGSKQGKWVVVLGSPQ